MSSSDWSPFDPGRPWLPGPPPQRRRVELYRAPSTRSLNIPAHYIEHDLIAKTFEKYLPNASRKSSKTYVFHGSAPVPSQDTVESFSRLGPSREFSRPFGYFSRDRAVYWTTSIQFAFAWCGFITTGSWDTSPSRLATWLIYVAEVDMEDLLVDPDALQLSDIVIWEDETNLAAWCDANVEKTGDLKRIPPPGHERADWGLVISRIPSHSADSLREGKGSLLQCFKDEYNPSSIRMVAACDDRFAELIAASGKEILHGAF